MALCNSKLSCTDYICYYNYERVKLGLQRLSPVEYRLKSMI